MICQLAALFFCISTSIFLGLRALLMLRIVRVLSCLLEGVVYDRLEICEGGLRGKQKTTRV